ncbi:MAG TPA: TraR/DksA family transcriptional regulator [Bryobacteraceae bacterium]|nr:TraR/DksA family transcriptional regulator [Bryobacteraceae bacterium]
MMPAFKRFRRILERKRRELYAEAFSYDYIHAIRTADEIDDCRLALDREMATADLERRSTLIRQIADALTRIDHDEYGVCVRCGAEIAVVRLDSVPWTPHCIRCQEIAEIEHHALTSKWTGHPRLTAGSGD